MVAFIRVEERPHHDSPSLPISLVRAGRTRPSYAGVLITERVMTQRSSGWSTWRRSRRGKWIHQFRQQTVPACTAGQRAPARRLGFANGHSKKICRRHGAGSLGRGAPDTDGNTGTNVGICFRSYSHDRRVEFLLAVAFCWHKGISGSGGTANCGNRVQPKRHCHLRACHSSQPAS